VSPYFTRLAYKKQDNIYENFKRNRNYRNHVILLTAAHKTRLNFGQIYFSLNEILLFVNIKRCDLPLYSHCQGQSLTRSVDSNNSTDCRPPYRGLGAVLQIGRSLVRSQLVSLECFIDIKSFLSHYGPGVDSVSNRNECQKYFLGVKAAGA